MGTVEWVDTHCHIHWAEYKLNPAAVIAEAEEAGVTKMLCVGTTVEDSVEAIKFVSTRPQCWATVGLHPHDAKLGPEIYRQLKLLVDQPKVVAVGECGLDYFYSHSPKEDQIEALRFQIELALQHDLPLVFHVREAFDDFWPVFDSYKGIRGVVHSFSATTTELDQVLKRGLYVGLNGIMTFTKDDEQLAAAKAVPLQKLLFETDAPFLTPSPYRGKICQPKHLCVTAEFLGDLRGEKLADMAKITSQNARQLFNLNYV